jgi:competence ComEA-like helix-hairpin-helix protein
MRKRKSPINSFLAAVRDYFTFTRDERKGALALVILQIILMLFLFFYKFKTVETISDTTKLEKTIEQFNALYRQDSIDRVNKIKTFLPDTNFVDSANTTPVERKLFVFNPNNLPDSLWEQLGLSTKQIQVIKNYESNGGKFFTKNDVKKMYCITPQIYVKLEPYISIPEIKKTFTNDTVKSLTETKREFKKWEPPIVDLNTADAEQLDSLPAIGEFRAASILKYRETLGGFTDIVQLKEVTGMNDSTYDAIKNFVVIRTRNIRKININTVDALRLKHPYLSASLAKIIINYRKMHGDYTTVSDIKKLGIVTEEIYKKLSPYLSVQ